MLVLGVLAVAFTRRARFHGVLGRSVLLAVLGGFDDQGLRELGVIRREDLDRHAGC